MAAMRHDAGHRVDHREREEPLAREGLDVGPDGAEVMRLADGQQRDAVGARLRHQRLARHRQHRQREAIAAIGAQHAGRHVLEHRHRLAVDPAAVERAEIARDAEDAVAVRAVALGARHVRRRGAPRHGRSSHACRKIASSSAHELVVGNATCSSRAILGQVSESR